MRFSFITIETDKLGRYGIYSFFGRGDYFFFMCSTRTVPLFFHHLFDCLEIEFQAPFSNYHFRQVNWKSIGIIEPERAFRGKCLSASLAVFLLKHAQPTIERMIEQGLLAIQHFNYLFVPYLEFRQHVRSPFRYPRVWQATTRTRHPGWH